MAETKVIRIAAEKMHQLDPEHAYEWHERYVRRVLDEIGEHLVLRCLYDGVVSELRDPNKHRGMPE